MDPLANPLWSSLTTVHHSFAIASHGVLRFPAEVAPFVAIEEAGPIAAAALEALVGDEPAYILGPRAELPAGWQLDSLGTIVQMICEAPIGVTDDADIALLGDTDRTAVLDLAALVYPHYFRPRTTELGRYHGIRGDGRLDAMIGERMALPNLREISAVCTHPSCTSRGLARRLLAFASNDLLARGETPFLHVSPQNTRALALYERNGYRRRIDVPFWRVARAA